MVSNLPAAIDLWEMKKEIESALLSAQLCLNPHSTPNVCNEVASVYQRMEAIESKYPMKAGVIIKEQRDEA